MPRGPLGALTALVSLGSLLLAPTARAIPAPRVVPNRGLLLGLATPRAGEVRLVRETWDVTLPEPDEAAVVFEVRYELTAAGAATAEALVSFAAIAPAMLTAEVEGDAEARAEPSPEELAALEALEEARVPRVRSPAVPRRPEGELVRRVLRVRFRPGTPAVVRVRGRVDRRLVEDWAGALVPAVKARHLVLVPPPRTRMLRSVDLPVGGTGFTGERAAEVRVHGAEGFSLDGRWEAVEDAYRSGARTAAQGEGRERTFTASGEPPPWLEVQDAPEPGPLLSWGGPYLGLGGAFGEGFRMRAGWELGIAGWLLPSVAADADFDGTWIVTPTLEAASPIIVVLPSFAIGLGAPIRLESGQDTRVGLRVLLTMHLVVGLALSIDVYPASGARDGFVETTLLGTVGL